MGGLQEFLTVKREVENITNLENYCWLHYDNPIAKIRNTAMGTLLINLSEGMDLEKAVRQYENIMAPSNYKRPLIVSRPLVYSYANGNFGHSRVVSIPTAWGFLLLFVPTYKVCEDLGAWSERQ